MLCIITQSLFAQNIGVNATGGTPDISAILDVNAANKGMLVPRISLSGVNDATTVLLPATSLLVWNTNASMTGGSGVGFYYNAGTNVAPNWIRLVNTIDINSLAAWRLTGNSGTNSGANFLGTIDARSLSIRTNSQERIKIDSIYGRVGIGTGTPLARLHVADSNVVFSASGNIPVVQGVPPVSGAGRRMMWYSDKAAFRVGRVTGSNWDKDSIGNFSFASGRDSRAQGTSSTAMGESTRAQDNASTAMGSNTYAQGAIATAIGNSTHAQGNSSTAIGVFTRAQGNFSTALGIFTRAKSMSGMAMGMYNDTLDTPDPINSSITDRIFQIGKGTEYALSNAMTVLKNGNIGLANKYVPLYPLSFENVTGGKISFWENGTTHYGIGVQSSLLQFFTDGSGADIGFGYGSSTSFSENMRIKGNGNVGIGVDPAAANKLQVNGKTQTTNFQMTTGANTNFILRSDAAGNASWVNPNTVFSASSSGGTLDQAYDFGGGGVGRTITADVNAVLIQGTDGLQVTGTYGSVSGSFSIAGAGNPKMLFVPSKAAFRAGRATGTQWDLVNTGNYSFAAGSNTRASGIYSTAFGNSSIASGTNAFASGSSVSALGEYSTAMGFNARSERDFSLSMGLNSIAKGDVSLALGYFTKAKSMAGTVIGMFNDTLDTPNPGVSAATDRLFVVGNGDTDLTRSNAMTVLKNGNMSIGNFTTIPNESRLVVAAANNGVNEGGQIQLNAPSGPSHNTAFFIDVFESRYRVMTGSNAGSSATRMSITNTGNVGIGGMVPTERLHVDGKIRIVDGTQSNNYFLASDANGVGTWKPVVIQSIAGTIGTSGRTIPYNTVNYLYTGCFITLPPGKYSVSVTMLMQPSAVNPTTGGSPANSSFWLRSTFADINTLSGVAPNQTGTPTPDIEGGTLASAGLVGPALYQMLIGTIIINNTSAGNKTYYYCAGNATAYNTTQSIGGFGGSAWNENRIVAIPME